MPRYVYKCRKCDGSFTTFHSMTEDQDYCELCGEHDSVFRIPQMPSVKMVDKKVGQIVDEYIEDTKKEIKKEKERLKKEDFKL